MSFAGYSSFDDCVSKNRDKDNPQAYCGSIKHKVEDKAVRKAELAKAIQLSDQVLMKHRDSRGSTEHHHRQDTGADDFEHDPGSTPRAHRSLGRGGKKFQAMFTDFAAKKGLDPAEWTLSATEGGQVHARSQDGQELYWRGGDAWGRRAPMYRRGDERNPSSPYFSGQDKAGPYYPGTNTPVGGRNLPPKTVTKPIGGHKAIAKSPFSSKPWKRGRRRSKSLDEAINLAGAAMKPYQPRLPFRNKPPAGSQDHLPGFGGSGGPSIHDLKPRSKSLDKAISLSEDVIVKFGPLGGGKKPLQRPGFTQYTQPRPQPKAPTPKPAAPKAQATFSHQPFGQRGQRPGAMGWQ